MKKTVSLQSLHEEVARVVKGQDEIISLSLVTILAEGHLLLVGVPGIGKTLLARTLAQALGLATKRIQCTPDLMPNDIIGGDVLEEKNGTRSFRFIEGALFTQLLLADEINRASPKTQSALLEAMEEKKVSASGVSHALPAPFHVLATHNPLEQEGTYPLPEAQLDRFLLRAHMNYPDEQNEEAIIISTSGNDAPCARKILTAQELMTWQKTIKDMPVGEKIVSAVNRLVRGLRPASLYESSLEGQIAWGPGTRAGQSLIRLIRARAALEGRDAPSHDDIKILAIPALAHRMALSPYGDMEHSCEDVIDDAVNALI